MSNKMVDVILHIDEDSTHDEHEQFRDKLLAMDGVMAADFRDDNSHLVVVEYDPEIVKSSAFIDTARNYGWHAELVGL